MRCLENFLKTNDSGVGINGGIETTYTSMNYFPYALIRQEEI